jgi:hypothetical protein
MERIDDAQAWANRDPESPAGIEGLSEGCLLVGRDAVGWKSPKH